MDDGADTRPLLALIAWTMCAPALLPYLLLVFEALAEIGQPGWSPPVWPQALRTYGGIAAGCGAWAMLAWMSWGWLRQRPLHWVWPLLNLSLGLLALASFGRGAPIAAMFASSAIAFAGYLAFWHVGANLRAHASR